jgi:ATP-binding cassette subfamily B (MDR/TAP) protein 1
MNGENLTDPIFSCSITRLLQRFYDPTEGRVEMNDIDIRSLDVAWLRRQIAVVDQDPILPDMTICENIALGLGQDYAGRGPQFVRDRVIEAAKLAEAHEFITKNCEEGYDTPVRQIHRLSGGQRQRIAIARALISRATILVCDEVRQA